MEITVRRFARNILLMHLALLLLVLAIVFFASRAIENGARAQALSQAQMRQEQLASQTAKGIEGFYQNILSDMDLLPRNEDTAIERRALPEVLNKAATRTPLGQKGVLIGFLLARQLEDRVQHLFVVDKLDMIPHALLRDDLQEEVRVGSATTQAGASSRQSSPHPAPRAGKTNAKHPSHMLRPSGLLPTPAETEVVGRNEQWLKSVTSQAIGKFELFDSGGLNLVALPLGPKKNILVVAAVPVDKIDEKFLSRLNSDKYTGAFLVDDSLTAMAASRPELVGQKLDKAGGPGLLQVINTYRAENYSQPTKILTQPFHLGDQQFAPAMLTAEPIEIVPGKRWFLLVASPLSEVDRIVSGVFNQVTWWAFFVTIAVTGILVSTSTQMIRGRAKLERVRFDVLKRELERARQIQQAWLPRTAPSGGVLDVAAVNYPAQHISGDFYNWFDLPDGRTAVAIGDVTGHGMSAAFLMATTQLLVRLTMQRLTDPGRCLTEVNRQLCTQVFNGQFVTMLLMIMDPASGTIELANAGHPVPLLADLSSGSLSPLPTDSQLVLGVEPDTTYQSVRLDFPAGTTLLLYTDGASDVQSPNGRRLGTDGLRRSLSSDPASTPRHDARALVDAVVHSVNRFRGRQKLGDDLTLVAVRFHAAAPTSPREPAEVLPTMG